MENLSLCCSLSDVLCICRAALTRCRMSPSIQCFQPLLFFSPFWTQTSLSPSQVTRVCMNQIINSVMLTRSWWTYKNKFKQCEYTITVASYHSPSSSLKKTPKAFKQNPNAFKMTTVWWWEAFAVLCLFHVFLRIHEYQVFILTSELLSVFTATCAVYANCIICLAV